MGPMCHLGMTSALLAGAKFSGLDVSPEIIAITTTGGVLIDSDKVFEIYDQKFKRQPPDITARVRLLHSVFAFPFGISLSYLSNSMLPFWAVLLHMLADAFIPGLKQDGRHYSTHPPLKWIMCPFPASLWYKIVPIGWPVKYPAQLNLCYELAEPIGFVVTLIATMIFWTNS